jgi:GTPase SAR1 family protein
MSLSDFLSGNDVTPPIITIVGDAGTGKSTLASKFPNPVFIRAEDGLGAISPRPAALKVLNTGSDVYTQLNALLTETHEFKTVVIDSITKLNHLFEKEIVDSDPKAKSIATANGGYGAGFTATAEMHWRVKKYADALKAKGIAVVFIAHTEVEKVDLPDVDPYSRFSISMHKKSQQAYINDVDMVGYLHRKIFSNDKGKVTDTGMTVFNCSANAARISKNRFGITEDIQVSVDTPITEILKFIPFYNNTGEAK